MKEDGKSSLICPLSPLILFFDRLTLYGGWEAFGVTVKKMPVTGYGYALDPLRSVGVDKKNEGQGVIPRPFMCVGSFACFTA